MGGAQPFIIPEIATQGGGKRKAKHDKGSCSLSRLTPSVLCYSVLLSLTIVLLFFSYKARARCYFLFFCIYIMHMRLLISGPCSSNVTFPLSKRHTYPLCIYANQHLIKRKSFLVIPSLTWPLMTHVTASTSPWRWAHNIHHY